MAISEIKLEAKLLGNGGSLTWKPDEAQQRASWELLVELATRITVARLEPEGGSLREALSSYHSLFASTRDILRRHGPAVAKRRGEVSFAYLAVWMLNGVVRPLLAKWHPRLLDHEHTRPAGVGAIAHERAWVDAPALRADMDAAATQLTRYARVFEQVCGVPPLVPTDEG